MITRFAVVVAVAFRRTLTLGHHYLWVDTMARKPDARVRVRWDGVSPVSSATTDASASQ